MILAGTSLIPSSEDKDACVFRCAVQSTHTWQTCCLAHFHYRQNILERGKQLPEGRSFPLQGVFFFAVCHQHESRWKNQPHPAGCRGPSWGEDRFECWQLQSTATEGPRLVVRAGPLH